MFDIGFFEIGLIAVIALLILGPERLPGVARKAGMWIGKMKSMVNEVKTNINEELRMEELNALKQAGQDLKKDLDMTKKELGAVGDEFRKSVDEVSGDTENVDIAAAISQSAPAHNEVTTTSDLSEEVGTVAGKTPAKKPGKKKDKPAKSRSVKKSALAGKNGAPKAPVQSKSTAAEKSTKIRKKPKKTRIKNAKTDGN